jgi:hypothetical protein
MCALLRERQASGMCAGCWPLGRGRFSGAFLRPGEFWDLGGDDRFGPVLVARPPFPPSPRGLGPVDACALHLPLHVLELYSCTHHAPYNGRHVPIPPSLYCPFNSTFRHLRVHPDTHRCQITNHSRDTAQQSVCGGRRSRSPNSHSGRACIRLPHLPALPPAMSPLGRAFEGCIVRSTVGTLYYTRYNSRHQL